ncbi:glycosyltransferase family 4 protein [soil metagenome]
MKIEPKVAVLQDGARRHYAVPIALQRAEILERVFTDWYTRRGSIESIITAVVKRVKPHHAKRMAERFAAELDGSKIFTKPSLMLRQVLSKQKLRSELDFFAAMSERTGRWVLAKGFGRANALYGFVRNISPLTCAAAQRRGLKVITDQMIAPFACEYVEGMIQSERFANWSDEVPSPDDRRLIETERQTWAASDRVVCASDYVRQGLIENGVAPGKIVVLPPPFQGKIRSVDRRGRTGPVTVGFVGKVGLRKGAPYFLQVAKRFSPTQVRFVMVGPVKIDPAVVVRERGAVELVGAVPRGEIQSWLERFDLLLFPSTCEGSAGVVSEAMASGLPIVTSPNSGSLVREGVDGFITAYDDVERMAEHVSRLAGDTKLRHQLGTAARARVEAFDLNQYAQKLKAIYEELLNNGAA